MTLKLNVGTIENKMGEGKNADYPHVYSFPRPNSFNLVKVKSICRQHIRFTKNLKFVFNRIENIETDTDMKKLLKNLLLRNR